MAGVEPDTICAGSLLSIENSVFPPKALIEILTEFSGADPQMLTRIVERWGSLSKEIKKAVLRVVG